MSWCAHSTEKAPSTKRMRHARPSSETGDKMGAQQQKNLRVKSNQKVLNINQFGLAPNNQNVQRSQADIRTQDRSALKIPKKNSARGLKYLFVCW